MRKRSSAPPVIPEIVKAYENDPRTKLARAAQANGSSFAPVAAGKYGMADGIARVLGGLGGAYVDKKMQDRYTHGGPDAPKADALALMRPGSPEWVAAQNTRGQDGVLALRQQQGRDGMTGALNTPPVDAAQASANPVATAIAAKLQGGPAQPPGPAAPGAAPSIPPAPGGAPQPPAPLAQPVSDAGGGPGGRRPFGPSPVGAAPGSSPPVSTRGAPSYLDVPVPEEVPDAPAPVEAPKRPDAIGPTRSRLLDAAYRIMSEANPYESARGQDMYGDGLSDQTRLDEAATERQQRLIDAEYGTQRDIYAHATEADRDAALHERADVIARNADALKDFRDKKFQSGERREGQAFQAGQNALSRAASARESALNRASAERIANLRQTKGGQGSWGLSDEEQDAINNAAGTGRVDVMRLNSRNAKMMARIFLANPNFDAMTNHGAAALIGNAPAQQKAMMAEMLPDVLANVRDAGKKLKFSDAQPLGKFQLWSKGLTNDPDLGYYMTQRNDAMQTLAQVMSGVGATDMRTKMEEDAAPKTMSPRAWDAWYQGQLQALQPRIDMYRKHRVGNTAPGAVAAPAAASDGWGTARRVK